MCQFKAYVLFKLNDSNHFELRLTKDFIRKECFITYVA